MYGLSRKQKNCFSKPILHYGAGKINWSEFHEELVL